MFRTHFHWFNYGYLQVHSEMGFASVLPEDVELHLSIDKPSCTRILLLSANRTRLYSL